MRRKMLALLFCLSLLTVLSSVTVSPVIAADYSSHNTLNVAALGYSYTQWNLNAYDGIYGNFTVKEEGKTLEWFITDQTNFQNFQDGKSYWTYRNADSVHDWTWQFQIPTSGYWYIVYWVKNDPLFGRTVEEWHCQDTTSPTITITKPTSQATYNAGSAISFAATATDNKFGVASISVTVESSGGSTVYTGSTTTSPLNKTWTPASTTASGWYTVSFTSSDVCGNSNTQSISIYIQGTSTGGGGGGGGGDGSPTSPVGLAGLGLIIVIVVALIAVVVSRSRKGQRAEAFEPVSKPTPKVVKPAEKEVVEAEPGFCPHCGAKTTPGATFCKNCGASLED